jgi:adenine-specific DNA methylase
MQLFKISQRRYLGNKNRILPFIDGIIKNEINHFDSFCDIFAGTGVVGNHFNTKNNTVIFNDLLYHNFVSINAFLSKDNFNQNKLIKIVNNKISYNKNVRTAN